MTGFSQLHGARCAPAESLALDIQAKEQPEASEGNLQDMAQF
jgi:hypothetical protein